MKTRAELNAEMEAKLKEAGIPFETVQVFGAIRINVHVTCVSVATANKWVHMLTKVFGKSPSVAKHSWYAKEQKGTCLLPTMRNGYLIGLVGA